VTVILDAPTGSRLMRENVYGWGSVCTAPCSARVPRDGDFVVEVPGSKSTALLDLEEGPERVRLKLTLPSQAALVTGTLLTYFGASTASTGLLVVLAGLALRDDRAVITGAVVAGVGGVGVCVGVPLIVMNHHSHVEQQSVAQGVRLFGRF
jgi:hypothetical protein